MKEVCPSKITCLSASVSFGSEPLGWPGVQDLGGWFWGLEKQLTSWWGQLPPQCGSGHTLLPGVGPAGGLIQSVSGLPHSLQI